MRMFRMASGLVLVLACLIWHTQRASAYQIYYSYCMGDEYTGTGWVEAYAFLGCSSNDGYWACLDTCTSTCNYGYLIDWQCFWEDPESFAAVCYCSNYP